MDLPTCFSWDATACIVTTIMDHSMLTAMTAVDNILAGRSDKSNIWAVNSEEEYHEQQNTAK